MKRLLGGLVCGMSVVFSVSSAAASPGAAADGAALFKVHCAACHGMDATGNGPMAPSLRHAPPDLTQLTKKNNGVFPAARVRRIVEGRDVPSHGDRDMPVWGDAFRREGASSKEADSERLMAVIQYLESIQPRLGQ